MVYIVLSQLAYDEAAADVQQGLNELERVLSQHTYICGEKFTEADLKMWPFAVRYDGAYTVLFRLVDLSGVSVQCSASCNATVFDYLLMTASI